MFFDQMFRRAISTTREKVGCWTVLTALFELSIRIEVSRRDISIRYILIDPRLSRLTPLRYITTSFSAGRYISRLLDQVLLIIELRTLEGR